MKRVGALSMMVLESFSLSQGLIAIFNVPFISPEYSIVKDSNADLTVGN